ncbi:MAG: LysM peptidoglycan-binding domain-containing protein, partial [Flavobacteriales bacterium]
FINPAFYNGVIPKNDKSYTLYVPSQKTGLFTLNEESIYNLSKEVKKTYNLASISAPRGNGKKIKYRVKSGDYLGKIANKYDCKVSDIKRWNNLRGNSLDIGQLLVIYTKKKSAKSETKVAKRSDKVPELKAGESYLLYTIKEGDNLWDIAKLFPEVSVEDILDHNRAINKDNLKPGKKIKIIQYD